MSALATLAAIDSLISVIGRVNEMAAVYAAARAEGRDINMDDVRAARAKTSAALDALDAAIAAAEEAERQEGFS